MASGVEPERTGALAGAAGSTPLPCDHARGAGGSASAQRPLSEDQLDRRSRGRRHLGSAAALVLLLLATAAAGGAPARAAIQARPAHCRAEPESGAPPGELLAALASPRDSWGGRLLAAPAGATATAASSFVPPLFYARAAGRRSLTASGAYYLPLTGPAGPLGSSRVWLDLADGSGLLAGSVSGAALTLSVGSRGGERFGSCLGRLGTPALAEGYLPILETRYRDAGGAAYEEESFAASVHGIAGLVAFVRLAVDARAASRPVELRFSLSQPAGDSRATLLYAPGGHREGRSLVYAVPARRLATVYVAAVDRAGRPRLVRSLARLYADARRAQVAYWRRRLARGASIVVPEAHVVDAERALLIQNLELGYRYSVGNAYQEFSFPETIDVARVMGEWGFASTEQAILRLSLSRRRPPTRTGRGARSSSAARE